MLSKYLSDSCCHSAVASVARGFLLPLSCGERSSRDFYRFRAVAMVRPRILVCHSCVASIRPWVTVCHWTVGSIHPWTNGCHSYVASVRPWMTLVFGWLVWFGSRFFSCLNFFDDKIGKMKRWFQIFWLEFVVNTNTTSPQPPPKEGECVCTIKPSSTASLEVFDGECKLNANVFAQRITTNWNYLRWLTMNRCSCLNRWWVRAV